MEFWRASKDVEEGEEWGGGREVIVCVESQLGSG